MRGLSLQAFWGFVEAHPYAVIATAFLAWSLPGLGSGYLWDWDETWYASCAYGVILTGDWLTPEAAGRAFLEKPPLALWSMTMSIMAFGANTFAPRLPAVLYSLGTILLVVMMVDRALGRREALVAGGVLATTAMFVGTANMAMTDAPLLLGVTMGLVAFWRMQSARPGDGTSYAWWCLAGGLGVGVAVMSKGPLGLMPGVVALLYMAVARDFTLLRRANWRLAIGLAAILAVAAPWYVLVAKTHQGDFVSEFFFEHNLGRMREPTLGHRGPFWYYVPVLLVGTLPWTGFLLAAPFRRRRYDRFDLFLTCWAAFPFVLFSFVATKLVHYVAPSLIPLAVLAAREVVHRVGQESESGGRAPWILDMGWVLATFTALAGCAAAVAAAVVFEGAPWPAFLAIGVVGVLGFTTTWLARFRRGLGTACLWGGGTLIAMFFVAKVFAMGQLAQVQGVATAAIEAAERARAEYGEVRDGDLFTFAHFAPSTLYYTRLAMRMGREPELDRALASLDPGETMWIIAREKHTRHVTERIPANARVTRVDAYDSLVMRDQGWEREHFRKRDRFRIRLFTVVRDGPDG